MVRFLILCMLFLNFSAAFGAVQRYVPNRYNHNRMHRGYYNPVLRQENLSALEKYALNKSYTREHPVQRLERLENLAFGSIQNGDIESRYRNVETAILSRPKNNVRRSALGNIVSYFSGQPTGVTPSLYQPQSFYPQYDGIGTFGYTPSYGNQRYNQYSNGIFGHGYSLMNSGFGNGSSVTILP